MLFRLINTVLFILTIQCQKAFDLLTEALMKSTIFFYTDHNRPYTLFMDAFKYAWSAVLIQEYTTSIDGKDVSHQHAISYVSGLFQDSPTEQDCICHIRVHYKLAFYLTDASIILRSGHLPLKMVLLQPGIRLDHQLAWQQYTLIIYPEAAN